MLVELRRAITKIILTDKYIETDIRGRIRKGMTSTSNFSSEQDGYRNRIYVKKNNNKGEFTATAIVSRSELSATIAKKPPEEQPIVPSPTTVPAMPDDEVLSLIQKATRSPVEKLNIPYGTSGMGITSLRVALREIPISSELEVTKKNSSCKKWNHHRPQEDLIGSFAEETVFIPNQGEGECSQNLHALCMHLLVRNENQRERMMPAECYKCQRYGHSQAFCQMAVRCIE